VTELVLSRRRGVRILLLAVVLALAAMWVYVLFVAPHRSPNRLDDRTWTAQAEEVCAAVTAEVAGLPPASSFAEITPKEDALRERAGVGQQATDLLRTQVRELRALPAPTGDDDPALVEAWLADWDIYLEDREEHVADWRAGNDHPFAESETEGGGPITDRMDELAKTNGMTSCVVPQDFG
jgi:hypothetical protein